MVENAIAIDWTNVDFDQMSKDLSVPKRDLRRAVGLQPFESLREAIITLSGSYVSTKPELRREVLADCLALCTTLADYRDLCKTPAIPDDEKKGAMSRWYELSRVKIREAKSVKELEAIQELCHSATMVELVLKWQELAVDQDSMIWLILRFKWENTSIDKRKLVTSLAKFYEKPKKMEQGFDADDNIPL